VKLTFLGTGTSFGVPQIGCACNVCRSSDPRDRRARVGAVLEVNGVNILIDAPPELRLQLIANRIHSVDAVLFTHDHADHTHGIDDLRAISVKRATPLPMYGPAEVLDSLGSKFRYIFDDGIQPLPGTYKPEGVMRALEPSVPVLIGGVMVTPVELPYGRGPGLRYRSRTVGLLAH